MKAGRLLSPPWSGRSISIILSELVRTAKCKSARKDTNMPDPNTLVFSNVYLWQVSVWNKVKQCLAMILGNISLRSMFTPSTTGAVTSFFHLITFCSFSTCYVYKLKNLIRCARTGVLGTGPTLRKEPHILCYTDHWICNRPRALYTKCNDWNQCFPPRLWRHGFSTWVISANSSRIPFDWAGFKINWKCDSCWHQSIRSVSTCNVILGL